MFRLVIWTATKGIGFAGPKVLATIGAVLAGTFFAGRKSK